MKTLHKTAALASISLTTMAASKPTAVMGHVRADASDPKALMAELQTAVKAMQDKNDQALTAKVDDVVLTEHVDRLNTAISDIQANMEAQATAIAAAKFGAGGQGELADAEYSTAFASHFKKGKVEASLNKGADDEGGYLAPVEWDRTITDKLVILSPMRRLARVQTIGSAGYKKLFNKGGTASGWAGEETARPETATATFGQMTYGTGELYANPSATQGMLDDSEINTETWLADEVQTEFASTEGTAFFGGDGTNKPTGILTYVTGAANAAVHPYGAITQVNSGHASTIPDGDAIMNLIYDLPAAFQQNASFCMNRTSVLAIRKLKDGNGNYLWQPSLAAGEPATLAGRPLVESEDMPNIAANANAILYGDFMQAYIVIDRTGTRVLRDPYSNKPYVMFYTTKRVGGGLLNPQAMRALKIAA